MRLVGAVGARIVTTLRTGFRSPARINEDNGNIGTVGLIDKRVFQLPEGPIAHHAIEPLRGVQPITDAIEVLHDDDAAGDARHDVHDLTAQLVVDISLPIPLFAFAGLDPILSALASHALTIGLEPSPPILNGLAGPEFDDAGADQSCRFRNSQVYAEELSTVTDGGRRDGTANGQLGVPFAVALKDTGITMSKGQGIRVALRDTEGEPEVMTSFAKGKAQDPTVAVANELVGIDAQTDRQVAVNGRPGCLFEMFGFAHPPVATGHADDLIDGHASVVGRQAQVTHLLITSMVDFDHAGGVILLGKVKSYLNGNRE